MAIPAQEALGIKPEHVGFPLKAEPTADQKAAVIFNGKEGFCLSCEACKGITTHTLTNINMDDDASYQCDLCKRKQEVWRGQIGTGQGYIDAKGHLLYVISKKIEGCTGIYNGLDAEGNPLYLKTAQ
eukprot:TRINITY_DN115359_c0_g1_i1.p1 TRINITY_DN115359_c0_g1~~TRINITY_DN115359_c0_g1_i1.p1  ORF type:complete len:127 (+),score=20.47 TRINITY_DN115359_c0_g1_i1:34-414(+)